MVALNEWSFTLVKVVRPETSCHRNMMSEVSLKGRVDPTKCMHTKCRRAEEEVSQMEHVVIGRK